MLCIHQLGIMSILAFSGQIFHVSISCSVQTTSMSLSMSFLLLFFCGIGPKVDDPE